MQVDLEKKGRVDIKLQGNGNHDKFRLIQDMIRGTEIKFGRAPRKDLESDFDIIIDSTGFHRNYLPRVGNETWIPCVQYKVGYQQGKEPFDDFYLRAFPSMSGYFWYFPLGDRPGFTSGQELLKNPQSICR